MDTILSIEHLGLRLNTREGVKPVLNDVSIKVMRGQRVALVGESGSGKSMTARCAMGLIPKRLVSGVDGAIHLNGRNITSISEVEMSKIRGRELAMIFQEPMSHLNPTMRIDRQVKEILDIHQIGAASTRHERVRELLASVGLDPTVQLLRSYPHQLSGGMRQRVLIAIAVACSPTLLIADEPTTALDVTVQAQVLVTLNELVNKLNTSVLFITHDLGVVAGFCDYVYVMKDGVVVEHGDIFQIFENPHHPYTKMLLASALSISDGVAGPAREGVTT